MKAALASIVVLFACAVGMAHAQSLPAGAIGHVGQAYPPGTIASLPQAQRAREAAALERAAIEARYAADQAICYPRFFSNSCMEQAAEVRRRALAVLAPVEVEAARFERLSAALARDAIIAERERENSEDQPARAQREQQASAARAARMADAERNADRAPAAIAKAEAEFAQRAADHAAKLASVNQKTQARAQQSPVKIAAFEKKQRDAQARQATLAAKKADKVTRKPAPSENKAGAGQ
ncbi:MAG TPA: hypothetical protein VIT92_11680 [Burkholderiaceae bacterium]